MNEQVLVWDEDNGQTYNRLEKQLQEQAEKDRAELLDHQRQVKRSHLKLRLLSVPFWGVYALIIARIVFDVLDSWSLREAHQVFVSITEPFLGLFPAMEAIDVGFDVSLNPAHFLAIAVVIAAHLSVMVVGRLMTETKNPAR